MQIISLTDLRANIYNKIDQLIETGESIKIKYKGHIITIILQRMYSKLNNIIKREDVIINELDELINNDWLSMWNKGNDIY